MEIVLATFGGICLLLSLGLGTLAQAKFPQPNPRALSADRIGAAVVGIGLIGLAVVLRIEGPTVSLVSTFGVTAGLVLLYSLYLFLNRSR